MSMHGSVSIFKWMGILQDCDQEKEYNNGGKNQLAAALLLVVRIKFLKPEWVVNAVTTAPPPTLILACNVKEVYSHVPLYS